MTRGFASIMLAIGQQKKRHVLNGTRTFVVAVVVARVNLVHIV